MESCGLLDLPLAAQRFLLLFRLRSDQLHASRPLIFREDHLGGRIDIHAVQFLDGPLAEHIKTADGVHILPPQLDPVRILLRQIKYVHNTTADRKLSRRFHLISLFISQLYEFPRQFPLLNLACTVYVHNIFLYLFQGDPGLHQTVKRRHNGQRRALQQAPQHFPTLGHKLVAVNIRLEKDQILGRIHADIPVIKLIVLINLPHALIAVGDDQFIAKPFSQPEYHV